MPVKTDTPTVASGPRYLNISGPFPFPGETQGDWDTRYATIESEVPLDFVAEWALGDSTRPGEMELATLNVVLNVTGPGQIGTDAVLGTLELGDVIYIEQKTGNNTITVSSVSTTDGVTTVVGSAEAPVGVLTDGRPINVWITAK
jgi:hypothetical protein